MIIGQRANENPEWTSGEGLPRVEGMAEGALVDLGRIPNDVIKPKDHAELSQRATELKQMPTALLHKLKADR
jgi:hypothetical protein